MRLLVVSQYFYPEQFRVSDVCFRLAELGHDITVLTGLPNYPAGRLFDGCSYSDLQAAGKEDKSLSACVEQLSGVRVLRCNLRPRLNGKKNLALNYYSFWTEAAKTAKRLAAQCGEADFDKILVFQYSPVTMAIPAIRFQKEFEKRTGKKLPLFLYCFDLWPESIVSAGLPNRGPIYAAVKLLSRKIYRKADRILISSENFSDYFQKKLQINENICYLPIYAESLFSAETVRRETDGSCNLLFAGNIGEMQSVETILEAAVLLQKTSPQVRIHLVGDGSALQRCQTLAKEFQLCNVTFHGRRPLSEMPAFYSVADAFLVTLKADPYISYTLPGKVQSYMASGKPLIGAIDGETADVIEKSGCGLVCPAEDFEGLAAIISLFACQPEKHRAYGANAKNYYNDHFSEEAFFNRLLSYLSKDS